MGKEHLMNLLGNSPNVTDKLNVNVINKLDIKLGQFTQE